VNRAPGWVIKYMTRIHVSNSAYELPLRLGVQVYAQSVWQLHFRLNFTKMFLLAALLGVQIIIRGAIHHCFRIILNSDS
jgi:hypothetical protein